MLVLCTLTHRHSNYIVFSFVRHFHLPPYGQFEYIHMYFFHLVFFFVLLFSLDCSSILTRLVFFPSTILYTLSSSSFTSCFLFQCGSVCWCVRVCLRIWYSFSSFAHMQFERLKWSALFVWHWLDLSFSLIDRLYSSAQAVDLLAHWNEDDDRSAAWS